MWRKVKMREDTSCSEGWMGKGRNNLGEAICSCQKVPHDGWVKASLVVDLFLIGNGAEHQDLERRESRVRAAKAELLERKDPTKNW